MQKFLFIFLFPFVFLAQTPKKAKEFNDAKISGKLHGNEQMKNPFHSGTPLKITPPTTINTTSLCSCWLERDSTWLICPFDASGGSGGPGVPPLYRNDDWSTAQINLPFNFCLYGTNYNNCIINNNGNVSFGAAYSTFTANSFPDPTYVMVAPFWGDVDTRSNQSGLVYYKLTPTYLVVQWDAVGYYNSHANLTNTFQLIMTDGNDPIISNGNNVAFCYKDMQWTTGDASGGSGGFGGTAATVGVNKGDGVNYIQFGLFDQAGTAYDGPGGNNDGVSWLDNQSIYFNSCTNSNNISPISTGALNCGDTITVCGFNDTLYYTASFSAPEIGQSCSITATSTTLGSNLIVTNTTSGTTATISFMVIANIGLSGFHQVNVTATDNGTPNMSTTITYVINIISTPAPNVNLITNTGQNVLCSGATTTLIADTSGGTAPLTLTWLPNVTTSDSLVISTTGTYTVVLSDFYGCADTATISIAASNPNVSIVGDTLICPGECTSLIAIPSGGSLPYTFEWGTTTNDTSFVCSPGNYEVIITDNVGCKDSAFINVIQNAVPLAGFTSSPTSPTQPNVPVTFTNTSIITPPATINGYVWNFGDGSGSTLQNPVHSYMTAGAYQVTLIVTASTGCTDTLSAIYLIDGLINAPNIITPNNDGINDALYFKGLEYYPNNHIVIFNRWGLKLFETDGYQNNWKGDGNPDGTYYYILDVTGGKPKTNYTGYFMIIR